MLLASGAVMQVTQARLPWMRMMLGMRQFVRETPEGEENGWPPKGGSQPEVERL